VVLVLRDPSDQKHPMVLLKVITITCIAVLAMISLIKGYTTGPSYWGEFYWFINYEHGFIKRGLIGQLFGSIFGQASVEWRRAFISAWHFAMSALLAATLLAWAARNIARQTSTEGVKVLGTVLALFTTSQFLPTLAHNTSSLDVYLYLALVISAVLIARRAFVRGALVASVAPFIHESFVFLWLTNVALIWWPLPHRVHSEHAQDSALAARGVATALPIVATAVVLSLHNQEAATREVMETFVPPDVKRAVIRDQFGQTLSSSSQVMLGLYRAYWSNFIKAVVFCVTPVFAMVLVYSSARFRERFWLNFFALSAAALAPSAMLLFGYDLSRFLVATAVSGLTSILVLETRAGSEAPSRLSLLVYGAAWALALLGLLLPLVYGNFTDANVIAGPLSIGRNILEEAVRAYVETGYRVRP